MLEVTDSKLKFLEWMVRIAVPPNGGRSLGRRNPVGVDGYNGNCFPGVAAKRGNAGALCRNRFAVLLLRT
jgi:hypothetical protein